MSKPWDKPISMARKCAFCGSQKPGMQPLTLVVKDKHLKCVAIRGYWHVPKCWEAAKKAADESSS